MPKPVITPKVDLITGSALTLTHDENETFEGHAFKMMYEAATAGAGEETAIGWVTPSLPTRIHLTFDAWATDEGVLEFREDPTVVLDEGIHTNPVLNRYRGHAYTPLIIDQDTAPGAVGQVTTYTVAQAAAAGLAIGGGVLLHHETLAVGGAAPFAAKMNTQVRGDRKWLLLPDTEYVVIITTSAVGGATNQIVLHWHEHISGDYAN